MPTYTHASGYMELWRHSKASVEMYPDTDSQVKEHVIIPVTGHASASEILEGRHQQTIHILLFLTTAQALIEHRRKYNSMDTDQNDVFAIE